MKATDLDMLTNPQRYSRISYGPEQLQFGDLRLPGPDTVGPYPVAIIIHGGCYLAQYNLAYMGEFAEVVAQAGMATWNIEYRRVGNAGGGWPGTFLDVAAAADYLRTLAQEYPLDLTKIMVIGHSSGGQLAIWLATRDRIIPDSELYCQNPLPVHSVIALAPVTDIARRYRQRDCDNSAGKLMGGSPDLQNHRYRQVSPIELLPVPTQQLVVLGDQDTQNRHEETDNYLEKARILGGEIDFQRIASSGHFEMIDPKTAAWLEVKDSILRSMHDGIK
jgi:acetyl esterase/lipase